MEDCYETYEAFAKIYDKVQKDSKYGEWKYFIEQVWRTNNHNPKNLLDVACGTCNNSILFARDGIKVTGIDSSKDMLKVAKEKIKNLGIKIFKQSFLDIKFKERFDAAICLDMSTGHILSQKDFITFLSNVYACLHKKGIFIFDVKPEQDYKRKFSKYTKLNEVDGFKYK
jgi:2-polyprenyl-3-methyl-5-hydroxy-6-metoxy-1,4-benzoquinol methylase